jgi:hypothetical protein
MQNGKAKPQLLEVRRELREGGGKGIGGLFQISRPNRRVPSVQSRCPVSFHRSKAIFGPAEARRVGTGHRTEQSPSTKACSSVN